MGSWLNEANKVSTSLIILLCHYGSYAIKIRTRCLWVGLTQISGTSLECKHLILPWSL